MNKITLQEVIAVCDAHTHGLISKEMLDDRGFAPLMLLSSGAVAVVELLVKRGLLSAADANSIYDQHSGIAMMEKARADEEALNKGKYSVSLEQLKNDLFTSFPQLRVVEQSMPNGTFDNAITAIYTVATNHMRESGFFRRSVLPGVMAQVSRLAQDIDSVRDSIPESIRKMYEQQ